MSHSKDVNIELVKGTLSDYLIKDKNNIVIGRFSITDLDKENKKCNVKLKFYRENDTNIFIEALKNILRAIFNDSNIFKANFYVNSNSNIKAFLNLGFTLEGILTDNLIVNGITLDELIFGLNRYEYNSLNKVNLVELIGKNIIVKNLTPDNADELLDYYQRNKEHLEKFEPTRDNSFYTIDVQRDILIDSYKQFMNGTSYDLGIYKDDKLIGKIKLSNLVYGIFKNGILGYSMDKEFQGKGYMKEAVKLVLDYCKESLEMHRVEASALVENDRSKNVLLGCNFIELGINKEYLFINGKWRDHITYYKIL